MSNFIVGGCSFTYGHELSDDNEGKQPSKKSWAHLLCKNNQAYVCTAKPGAGNTGIARRVFQAVAVEKYKIDSVVVMWSFVSRYDWAMPRHRKLEDTRWATISPWDTDVGTIEAMKKLQGSEPQQEEWRTRQEDYFETGVRPFAESLYKHAANDYHETYLSWQSIVWLQNILQKKNIPYFFTLADNSLFYIDKDPKMNFYSRGNKGDVLYGLYNEIDFSKWFFFGERCMGFNQWAWLNDYDRGTTHPLDQAHKDAVKLMEPQYKRIIGEK